MHGACITHTCVQYKFQYPLVLFARQSEYATGANHAYIVGT